MADLLRVNYLIYMHALNVKFLGSYLFYVSILILTRMIKARTFINSCTFSKLYAPYSRSKVYSIWVQRLNMLILDEEKALLYGSKINFIM